MRHINQNLQNILFLAVAILFGFSNSYAQDSSALHYMPVNENEAYVTYITHPQSNNYTPYSGNIVIPSVVSLNNKAYTITGIGDWAFFNGKEIESITIPNTVRYLGRQAFAGCDMLQTITIPGSVQDMHRSVLSECKGLKEVILEEGMTVIGENMFGGSSNIESITIPSSVTTIGEMAFTDCDRLTTITIPANVTSAGVSVFQGCDGLKTATIHGNAISNSGSMFARCTSLTDVIITNGVTGIGEGTFDGCSSLTNITIPGSVSAIGYGAFSGCSSLTSITIPNSVTNIGYYAFMNCSSLENITIPDGVTSIGEGMFAQCSKLRSIEIPENVTAIGSGAFANCTELTEVIIPSTVRSIGNVAFEHCYNLKKVTSLIPANKLFSLETTYEFYLVDLFSCILYVPYGAKEKYASTKGWKDFKNIVELTGKSFDLTVSAAKYATLYLDFNAEIPEGVEVYTASTVDGNRLMMQQVTGVLPANTGVIVRAEQGTYTFDESNYSPGTISNNLFRGSVNDKYITPSEGAKYYVLAMKDGVVGMYEDALTGGTFKNNAHKAYLVLGEKNLGIYDEEVDTENPGMQLSNSYYFDFGGTTTVAPVVTESEENVYYDLSGRRVENPVQGIYIVNGRKVLVK